MLGPVFRAYQPAPGRLVAVKQFRLGISPDEAQRFAASLDRIIAADLSQPGIAAPIAAGLTDASPFLALDFVAAESFDVAMRESGPAQPKEVVSFTRQLAAALDAAAAAGVVHGALHPRDVLMAHDDVRMTGLGIAQALESIGTAAPIRRPYAAPERMAGASWDRRADIYSLAALAYEMLTGRRVLATGSESAENLPQVEGADLDRLRVVFAKALADKAANRFETAGEFADALERALTPVSRARSNGRRRRGGEAQPDLELPLDIALDTPPLGDTAGPHVEISAIDAAMPASAGAGEDAADLALHQARSSEPDLANLDTRLDDFEASQVPELELHAIEQAQADAPSSRAPHGEHVLELDALDAATDRIAAARDAVADGRDVDTEAISLTVPPLSDDVAAGSPLAAIEQALASEVVTPGDAAVKAARAEDAESATVAHAALDAALDLQSSEATVDRDLRDLPLAGGISLSRIDETLARADETSDTHVSSRTESALPTTRDLGHASRQSGDTNEPPDAAGETTAQTSPQAARPASPVASPAPRFSDVLAERDHEADALLDDEDDGHAPWDREGLRASREEEARWPDESPGFAVDAALDAITARTTATSSDTSSDADVPLADGAVLNGRADEAEEPVPAMARSLSLGQDTSSSSGGRPILLGVALGLLVGFAFGYGVGQWRSGSTVQTTSSSSESTSQPAPADTARESARVAEPAVVPPAATPASPETAGQPQASAAAPPATSAPATPSTPPPAAPPPPSRNEARGGRAATPPSPRSAAGRAEQAGAATARQAEAGRLVVRTTPSGANVTIDGKDAGLTPVTTTLQPGFHTVRLSHQGYVTTQRRVRITAQPAQPIDVELVARPAREVAATPAAPERASGSLVLDSRPTGARVYVDGALVGSTPMQIDAITGGDHAVRFEMDGFGPWSTTARVAAGGKTRVSGSLER